MAHRNVVVDVFLKAQSTVGTSAAAGRQAIRELRREVERPIKMADFAGDFAKAAASVRKAQEAGMWGLMGRETRAQAVRENLASPDGARMHGLLQSLTYSARTEEAAARRQQIAVEMQRIGSSDHIRALREERALRLDAARAEKANRMAALVEEHGRGGAMLRRVEEALTGPGRLGRNVAMGGIGAIAGLAASSPSLGATLGGSMQLVTGSLARVFLPQIMTMASMAQEAAVRISSLNQSTRDGIGTTAKWAIGIGAATYGASLLTRTFRRMSDVWRSVGSLGTPSLLAPMTGSRGGLIGFAGRAAGRVGQAGGIALGGLAAGQIAESFGATSLAGGIYGGTAGLTLSRLMGFGGRVLGPAGFLIGTGLANAADQAQIQQQARAMGERAPDVRTAVREALGSLENVSGWEGLRNQARSRFRALQGAMQPFGIRPEQLGLYYDRSEWFGLSRPVDPRLSGANFAGSGPLGAARIAQLAELAAQQQRPGGLSGGTSPGRAAMLAAQQGGGGFTPSLRHFMALDTNFQSRQFDVGDLHNIVQAEAVRTPLQQALFAQEMQTFQELLRWMETHQGQVQPLLERLIAAVENGGARP